MSTSVHPLLQSVRTPDVSRAVAVGYAGAPSDLLHKAYLFLRKLPPVVAAVTCWSQLHTGQVSSFKNLLEISLTARHLVVFLCLVVVWNLCFRGTRTDGRRTPRLQFLRSQMGSALIGSTVCALLLLAGRVISPQINLQSISLTVFWLRCVGCATFCISLAAIVYEMAYRFSTPRLYLIVGSRRRAVNVYKDLKADRETRKIVLGFVDPDSSHAKYLPCDYLGEADKLEDILISNPVDQVCLAIPIKSHYEVAQQIVSICERVGVQYSYATDIFQTTAGLSTYETPYRFKSGTQGAIPNVEDNDALLKRSLDVVVSALLLVFLLPLMICIAIWIKIDSAGPVFYGQSRCGKKRQSFRMYKFRSMVAIPDRSGTAAGLSSKAVSDTQITKAGRILRLTSLDELPQLLNVLKGEMSLVGPRPMSLREVRLISDAHVMRRFSVKPGITGLWQISGRNSNDFDTWVRFDLQYIDRWSFALDLRILLRTLPAVLHARGTV